MGEFFFLREGLNWYCGKVGCFVGRQGRRADRQYSIGFGGVFYKHLGCSVFCNIYFGILLIHLQNWKFPSWTN